MPRGFQAGLGKGCQILSPTNPIAPTPENVTNFDLLAYVRDTLRWWPVVVVTLVLSIALGHVVFRYLPVQYRASAELLIFDPTRASTASIVQSGVAAHELDPVAINTQVEMIRSNAALERVARSLRLDRVAEFQYPGLVTSLRQWLGLQAPPPTLPSAATAGIAEIDHAALGRATIALSKRISVERVPLSYVVTVSATAQQGALAAQLVTGLVQEYLDAQDELTGNALSQSAAWLRSKVAELQTRVGETNSEIERLRAESGITLDGKGTLTEQQRSDLNAKLAAVRTEIGDHKSRIELAQAPSSGADADPSAGISSPALTQMRLQLSLMERDEAQLSQRFGPQHAQVIAMEQQATSLRRAINDETARVVAEEQSKYEVALRREQALVAELEHLGKAQVDSGVLARLQDLQHAAEADTRLLDTYASRLQDVGAAQSLGGSDKRILSPAEVPNEPSSPRKPLVYAGAAVFGLLVGVPLAVLLGQLTRSMPPAGPGQRRFGQPVLGNVPRLKRAQSWGAVARSVRDDPRSAMSTAMRAIQVNLELGSHHAKSKIIVVTSSSRREGRSTVAVALAAAMAQSGRPTLLVDCDAGSPSGLLPSNWRRSGLVDLLAGEPNPLSVMRRDPAIGCHVVALADERSGDTETIIFSERLGDILERLRDTFAFVVIDAPPLMPIPEACVIVDRADAVLLVVDASRSRADKVRQALALLASAGTRSVGIVLNRLPLSQLRRAGLATSGNRPRGLTPGTSSSWAGRRRGDRVTSAAAAERTS